MTASSPPRTTAGDKQRPDTGISSGRLERLQREAPASAVQRLRGRGRRTAARATAGDRACLAVVVPTRRRAPGSGEGVVKENVIAKAQRYLRETRVRILFCDEDNGIVTADVRGSGASYSAGRDDERAGAATARREASAPTSSRSST